jgi:hypothetical protein
MSQKSDASETALLPQYQASPAFMERFLDAIHEDGGAIERSENKKGSIKLVDDSEVSADALDYFVNNKPEMEQEFRDDLIEQIGEEKADWFIEVIAQDWYDGKGLRNGKRIIDIKTSVRNCMKKIIAKSDSLEMIVENYALPEIVPKLSELDVARILCVNKKMMIRHIEGWKAIHPDSLFLSDDDIYLRRGLSLDAPINTSKLYKEWDYINSYSIAFSAPEKFAQMQVGKTPALISGDIHLFDGRILFFSPFIPGMSIGQLEVGIIPGDRALSINAQGEHGGILEYIIGVDSN